MPEAGSFSGAALLRSFSITAERKDCPMDDYTTRTAALIGPEGMTALQNASVAVIGLGGVGGSCAEALARCGVGRLILMDHDTVDVTNVNRQLFATSETVGMAKTDAARQRLLAVNPRLQLVLLPAFYGKETKDAFFSLEPDLVIDAIDTVTAKLHLAAECRSRGIPLVQCLGTGNRMDPSLFRLGKIEDTAGCGCGLARVMRRELKRRGLSRQDVVYSVEEPRIVTMQDSNGRHPPASISFCPPVAGYLLASWAVKKLLGLL